MSRPALLIDRDGTLIREHDAPPRSAGEVELLAGGAAALARAQARGFALVMITNQSAFARGWLRFEEFAAVQRAIDTELAAAGARLDAVYFCPHHPGEGEPPYRRACECRKPGSALVLAAQRELELDLSRSWMIGDARRDLAAGAAAGVRGILVATGKGAREAEKLSALERSRTQFAADLARAVDLALGA